MMRIFFMMILIVSLTMSWGTGVKAGDYRDRPQAEPSGFVMTYDGLVGRPIGIATTATGVGVLIATMPFSLISGSTGAVARRTVADPARWTFRRPLGRNYMGGHKYPYFLP